MRIHPRLRPIILAAILLSPVARAEALSITITEVTGNPGPFRNVFGFSPNPLGSQAFLTVLDAAANSWEGFLLDDRLVSIQAGFSPSLGSSLARETEFRVLLIAFNPAVAWFADTTPLEASEYADQTFFFDDFGAGPVNSGIVHTGATGNALGRFDLFSVALHEIGHALGLDVQFDTQHGNVPILVEEPLPFSGSSIPYAGGGHLFLPNTVMRATGERSVRRVVSDVDILAVAQAGQFTDVQLNTPQIVPEPASALLLLTGAAVLRWRRRRG